MNQDQLILAAIVSSTDDAIIGKYAASVAASEARGNTVAEFLDLYFTNYVEAEGLSDPVIYLNTTARHLHDSMRRFGAQAGRPLHNVAHGPVLDPRSQGNADPGTGGKLLVN